MFINSVNNGAFERCMISVDPSSLSNSHERAKRLVGHSAICRAPVFTIDGVNRYGFFCNFNKKRDWKSLVIGVEQVVGPAKGVGNALQIIARPEDKTVIPNLGLPTYHHNRRGKAAETKSFFGDERGEITGLDAVGAYFFDERIIIGGIRGRRFFPQDGVTAVEATSFVKICLMGMEDGMKVNGEFNRPVIG